MLPRVFPLSRFTRRQTESRRSLRWKLLIAASLLAAAAGSGVCYALAHFLAARPDALPVWAAAGSLLAPLAAVTYAAVFVYRHTSRRRKLQAAATALLASLLTLAALTLGSALRARPEPEYSPAPLPKTT
jgi:uncharacterized BrkB/YihY/UPF0761 family membrane protein